jgi:ligand-binding sensor domain-containing protein
VDDGLVSDTVFSIIKDGNENMWFGTPRGLSRYDGNNWSTFNTASDQLISDTIAFLDIDPAGMLWIASPKGLSQFNGQEFIHYLK